MYILKWKVMQILKHLGKMIFKYMCMLLNDKTKKKKANCCKITIETLYSHNKYALSCSPKSFVNKFYVNSRFRFHTCKYFITFRFVIY